MRFRIPRLTAIIAVLALVVVACGDDAEETTTTAASTDTTEEMTDNTEASGDDMELSQWGIPIIEPIDVDPSVTIGIAGSSTVFPLSEQVLILWQQEGGPEYTIDSIGSGGGIDRFCVEGASDIANASRPIQDEEIAQCEEIGRTPIPIRVGTDALSLVISTGNYFAQELTIEEIATAFSLTDSGATWADVNPDFPAHPIAMFRPGETSGTFDYFNEVIFEEAEPSPMSGSIAEDVGEEDNVTAIGVAEDGCTEGDLSSTCAIGFFGYAYYQENADVLQAVAVEGVEPSLESVNANEYPISRPLFMYTDAGVIEEKPQVAEFIAFYLNNVNDLIGEVGYFPAPDEALQEAADNIKAAAGW